MIEEEGEGGGEGGGEFWEDYEEKSGRVGRLESEFTQYEKEAGHCSKGALTYGIESRGRRSKSPGKHRVHSSEHELSLGSLGQSTLIMRREREAFFSHLDKLRKAHQL